eukprot:GEMP01023757.1.p1 GENE.GEMP01023757.1~~GEMP01023757.1.p1  ORF type:complete len:579 (+),score=109.09 GEMP01023757.1:290-2026(+)
MMAPVAIPLPRGHTAPGAVVSPKSTPSPTAIRYNPMYLSPRNNSPSHGSSSNRRLSKSRPQLTPYDLFTERQSRHTEQYLEPGPDSPIRSILKTRPKIQEPPWQTASVSGSTRRSTRGKKSKKSGRSSAAKSYYLGERRPRDVSAGVLLLGSSIPISFYDRPPSVVRGSDTNFRRRTPTQPTQPSRPPPKAKLLSPPVSPTTIFLSPRKLSDIPTLRFASQNETPAVPTPRNSSPKEVPALPRKPRVVPSPRRTPPASPTPPVPPPRQSRVGRALRSTYRAGGRSSKSMYLNDSRWTNNEPWIPEVRRVLRWDASYYGPGRISFTEEESECGGDDIYVKMPDFDVQEAGARAHELLPDSSPAAMKKMSIGTRAKLDIKALDNVRCVYTSLEGKTVTLPAGNHTVGDVRFKATKEMKCVWHEVILMTATSVMLSNDDAPAPKLIYIQQTTQKKFEEGVWMNTLYQHTIRNDAQGLLLMPDKMKEQQIPRKRVMQRVELQLRRDNGSEVLMPEEEVAAAELSPEFRAASPQRLFDGSPSPRVLDGTNGLRWPSPEGSFDSSPSPRVLDGTNGLQWPSPQG